MATAIGFAVSSWSAASIDRHLEALHRRKDLSGVARLLLRGRLRRRLAEAPRHLVRVELEDDQVRGHGHGGAEDDERALRSLKPPGNLDGMASPLSNQPGEGETTEKSVKRTRSSS